MFRWSIYYSDHIVSGTTREEWIAAPVDDVQVVIEWRVPSLEKLELKWTGVFDRCLWTGEDEYDPFGWGVKYGKWMTDEGYKRVADEAFYGN